MREILRKFFFPVLLTISGFLILFSGAMSGQGGLFTFGGLAILAAGITWIVAIIAPGVPAFRWVTLIVFLVISGALGSFSYTTIKKDIDFKNEWDHRKEHIIQRLMDIRTSQLAYKAVHNQFTPSFDTLLTFVKQDSFLVIKAIGTVPDTLSEQEAVEMGLVKRDTSMVAVLDSIFSPRAMKKRKIASFNLDSLPYVPFSGDGFKLHADMLDRGNLKVPVFAAADSNSFNPKKILQVGSMTEPTTSGNWE